MKAVWLRLGRTDAINGIVISVVATLQFVGSFVVTNTDASGRELLFVGCVVVSVLVVVALLLFTRYVLIPITPVSLRPVLILVMFQVAAFARAFIYDWLLVSLQLSSSDFILSRIYGSQFNTFVAGIVVSSLVSMAREFSENNEKLLLAITELRSAQDDVETRLRKRRRALVSSIRSQLESALSSLTGTNQTADAHSLKSLIDDVVRPISHRLGREFDTTHEEKDTSSPKPIRWSSVIKHSLESNPIHPVWLTLWTAFISFQVIATAAGPDFLLPYLLACFGFALWFILSWFVWKLTSRWLGLLARGVLFSVLMLTTPLLNIYLQLEFGLDFFNPRVLISAAIYFFVMSWSTALVISVNTLLKRTNQELMATTAQLRRQLITDNVTARHFEQAVSLVLHGPIQDAISASLKRIESMPENALSANTEEEIIRQHIEDALHLLNESPMRHFSVEQGLTKLAALWSGVVEIDVNLDSETADLLEATQTTSSIVIEIVREAVSNSIRHGDASRISIDIHVNAAESDVFVTVINNGAPLPQQHTAGIGSQLLDDMTLTWSRENRSDTVVLTATVPL